MADQTNRIRTELVAEDKTRAAFLQAQASAKKLRDEFKALGDQGRASLEKLKLDQRVVAGLSQQKAAVKSLADQWKALGDQGKASLDKLKFDQRIVAGMSATSRAAADSGKSLQAASVGALAFARSLLPVAGAYTVVETLRGIQTAGTQAQSVLAGLEVGVGSAAEAAKALAFVSDQARRLGIDSLYAQQSFVSLTNAVRGTATEGQGARELFVGVLDASRALGLSAEQTGRAFQALSQIASKGTVSLEEVRGQLAEAIPGSTKIAADALGLTVEEFTKLVASGDLAAETLLNKLGPALQKTFGDAAQKQARSAAAEYERASNAARDLGVSLSKFTSPLSAAAAKVTGKDFSNLAIIFDANSRSVGELQGKLEEVFGNGSNPVLQGVAKLRAEMALARKEAEGLARARAQFSNLTAGLQATPAGTVEPGVGQLSTESDPKKREAAAKRREAEVAAATRTEKQQVEAALAARADLAKSFADLQKEIAAPRSGSLIAGTVIEPIRALDNAKSAQKAGDSKKALEYATQARDQIEALNKSGAASQQFLSDLAKQAAEVAAAAQQGTEATAGQQAAIAALKEQLTSVADLAKIPIDINATDAQAQLQSAIAALQGSAAQQAIVVPIVAQMQWSKDQAPAANGKPAGFEAGGYTGNLPKKAVAGVVHGGEYVFSARSVDRLGLANLDRLHRQSLRGYEAGGHVAPASAGASAGNTLVVKMPSGNAFEIPHIDDAIFAGVQKFFRTEAMMQGRRVRRRG